MDGKSMEIPLFLLFLLLSPTFSISFSELHQIFNITKSPNAPSTVVFPIHGNVYPLGYYTVNMMIGHPPKVFDLDMDTGSDLTWVQCDAPCRGCTRPPEKLYKPRNNLVPCSDPLCAAVQSQPHHCTSPNEQCDYEIQYADHGSSLGVLVRDNILLQFTHGSSSAVLAFGCGYDQTYSGHNPPPSTAGVLGLGNGRVGILSQLHSLGIIRNVLGHCLSGRGGGFLFLGDKLIPSSSGVVWTPILQTSSSKHYKTGPADLFFNGKSTPVKGLDLIFDSGSSYTYLNSQAYRVVLDLVTSDLRGKPLSRAQDPSLPICWKGAKPFKSLREVSNYFKIIALTFTRSRHALLELQPKAYLILTNHGNVCLGILHGTEIGLGNINIIGGISMQDKMVIYDNERQRIGWISANCDRIPKSYII